MVQKQSRNPLVSDGIQPAFPGLLSIKKVHTYI